MEMLLHPWPWYIAGPLIGLTVPLLLLFGGKNLGVSSSFRHFCAILLPNSRLEYLRQDTWSDRSWNMVFVIGIALGAFLAAHYFSVGALPLLPASAHTAAGAIRLLAGGVLIGFGTRWASGCTSGHAIMGLSNLQKASLVATLCFFAGGLTAAFLYRMLGWGA